MDALRRCYDNCVRSAGKTDDFSCAYISERLVRGFSRQRYNMLNAGQICYAEKHGLYEMFKNVVSALVVDQPSDPMRFIARYLKRGRHVDVPKIILIAPPRLIYTDAVYIALDLAKKTGAVTVDRRNVLRRQKNHVDGELSTDFATALTEYMRAKGASVKGWILLGVPNDKNEADMLISLAILPTHTIVLDDDGAAVTNDAQTASRDESSRQRYENSLLEIKTKFRLTLKEIRVGGRSLDEVTGSCLERVLSRKPSAIPFRPRVTLIGPSGSNRFLVASAISEEFNIVHVDLRQILTRKKIDDDSKIPEATVHSWIKAKLTQDDCVENGYVLTGFPRTKNDLQWLDSTEMAPNRVVFLATGFRDVYAHYANRCFDGDAGAFVSLDRAVDGLKSGSMKFERLSLQSPPDPKRLLREFKTYGDRLREMLRYCGDGCHVAATADEIAACVSSGSPATGPKPQNREPRRLDANLIRKMFVSHDADRETAFISDVAAQVLSEDARRLLCALERKRDDDCPPPPPPRRHC